MLLQQQVFKLFAFSKIMKSPNSWSIINFSNIMKSPNAWNIINFSKIMETPNLMKNHLSCLSCLVQGKVLCGTWFWSCFKCCCVYEFDFIPWFLTNSTTTKKKKKATQFLKTSTKVWMMMRMMIFSISWLWVST